MADENLNGGNLKSIFAGGFFTLFLLSALVISGCQTSETPVNDNRETIVAGGGTGKTDELKNGANGANENSNPLAATENSNRAANVAAPTPDKVQREKVIERYISGVAKVSDASEYQKARKILYGDLDGDGDEDAVAQFTIEGAGGGNNYAFYLAAFRNDKGQFTGVTDEAVGGKLNRDVDLKRIDGGVIYLDTKEYDEDDGACCPSIAKKTSYVLQGNKLVEKK